MGTFLSYTSSIPRCERCNTSSNCRVSHRDAAPVLPITSPTSLVWGNNETDKVAAQEERVRRCLSSESSEMHVLQNCAANQNQPWSDLCKKAVFSSSMELSLARSLREVGAFAARTRRNVETPIALSVDKRLLLTRDYAEIIAPMLMSDVESKVWELQLAKIHQATCSKEDLLQGAGLKLTPVERLPVELDGLLFFIQAWGVASPDMLQRVKELCPQFRSDFEEVHMFGIPVTLVHGEIFMSNLYRPSADGCYGAIDWGNAAISHPFFDMRWCTHPSAYFGSWLEFLSRSKPDNSETITMDRLSNCLNFCQRLLPVFVSVKT